MSIPSYNQYHHNIQSSEAIPSSSLNSNRYDATPPLHLPEKDVILTPHLSDTNPFTTRESLLPTLSSFGGEDHFSNVCQALLLDSPTSSEELFSQDKNAAALSLPLLCISDMKDPI